jgi:hypothetical protein
VKPWVNEEKRIKPRMGRKRFARVDFLSPLRGLGWFNGHTHGFTVGYYLSRLRRFHLPMPTCRADVKAPEGRRSPRRFAPFSSHAHAPAPWNAVALHRFSGGDFLRRLVRKSFSRQLVAPKSDEGGIFAGVRVQALPFFQRRVIRQRDGKNFAPLFRAFFFVRVTEV